MSLRRPAEGLDPAQMSPDSSRKALNWRSFSCDLVTPLYGGGVVAGEVDERMPIRAAAIRGQLRFWWRLLAKHKWKLGTLEEISRQEFLLWGGIGEAAIASQVFVRIDDMKGYQHPESCQYKSQETNKAGEKVTRLRWTDWAAPYVYALFPAQEDNKTNKKPSDLLRPGLHWTLSVGCPFTLSENLNVQLVETLRWWASFGGVGARTRRGLGAVHVSGLDPVSREEAQAIHCGLHFVGPETTKPLAAWESALAKLRDFRQGDNLGRNPGSSGSKRAGRSRWPEPASIRALTQQHRIKHGGVSFKPVTDTPPLFPRAAFGLPIVFQFQGDKSDEQSDPPTVTLEARTSKDERIERMASPLIIRPCLGKNGEWRGGILALPERLPPLMPLALLNDKKVVGKGHMLPDAGEHRFLPPNIPTKGRSDDAVEAFLMWLEGAAK